MVIALWPAVQRFGRPSGRAEILVLLDAQERGYTRRAYS